MKPILESMNDGIHLISEQHIETIKRLDKLDERVDKLDARVDKLQDDVTEIKHKLSEKVDLADFQKLEKRLVCLEKIVLFQKA